MWQLISSLPQAFVWSQLIALTGTGYEQVLQAAGVNLTIFVPANNELTQQLIRLFPNGAWVVVVFLSEPLLSSMRLVVLCDVQLCVSSCVLCMEPVHGACA